MKIFTLFFIVLLSGCAQLAGIIPTMQHCDEVKYIRKGNQIEINAKCSAPIGGGNIPIPGL